MATGALSQSFYSREHDFFAALCTAANIKQRHLIRGTAWARTANGRESRDQAAKTNPQLAPISIADIECGTDTATHFLTGKRSQFSRRIPFSVAGKLLRLPFKAQDSVHLHEGTACYILQPSKPCD